MNESSLHCSLVSSLHAWFLANVQDCASYVVYVDNEEANKTNVPPTINGSVPDFYSHKPGSLKHYVGEAKTSKDLERPRSREQFKAFLKFCHDNSDSLLIIAVPWFMSPCAKSLLKAIAKENGYDKAKFIVLADLPG